MDQTEFHGILEIEKILQEPLEVDSPVELRRQLAIAEAWQSRVSFQYRNGEALLSQLRKQYLLPKSKEHTDMDRTIALENSTRAQQANVDLLKDMAEIIVRRILLGQSLLKSTNEELRAGLQK